MKKVLLLLLLTNILSAASACPRYENLYRKGGLIGIIGGIIIDTLETAKAPTFDDQRKFLETDHKNECGVCLR